MIAKSRCRTGLQFSAAAAALLAFTAPTVVVAQQASYTFDIPAQDLGSALRAYARASRQQVSFSGQTVRGKRSEILQGVHSADDALRILLRGSGLSYTRSSRGVILVGAASPEQGRAGAQTGTIIGRVVEGETQRRLAGAQVTLVGARRSTTTNEQGEFRFSGVNPTQDEISVSFLGYPTQTSEVSVQPGQSTSFVFLFGVTELEDIVVSGQRSARALARNRERSAENVSTVISADLLGNFQGTTISDALRRAPGVAFEQDPVTGEGTNIIVRGLAPDYNQVKIDGVALVDARGTGRAANLGNLLADSISEITINKTLLPSQDSAGTGGLVEVETTTPLDRPRRYANISSEQAWRDGDFGSESQLSATLSAKLGSFDQFGVSLSVQKREQDLSNLGYSLSGNPGPYLPLGPAGQPLNLSDIDPRVMFPFEPGVNAYIPKNLVTNYNEIDSEFLTATLSAEWQISDATNLSIDWVHAEKTSSTFTASTNLNQPFLGYQAFNVPGLSGERRYALRDVFRPGTFAVNLSADGIDDQKETTDTVSIRGVTQRDSWSLKYNAGATRGRFSVGSSASASFSNPTLVLNNATDVLPEAVDPITGAVYVFGKREGDRFPVPLLTEAGFGLVNSRTGASFQSGYTVDGEDGSSDVYVIGASARRSFDGDIFRYIEAGFEGKISNFEHGIGLSSYYTGLGNSAASLGVDFVGLDISRVGGPSRSISYIEGETVRSLFNRFNDLAVGGVIDGIVVPPDPLAVQAYTDERDFAGYLQARIDFGPLEVTGGLRVSRTSVKAGFPSSVSYYDESFTLDQQLFDETRVLAVGEAAQTDVLPRIALSWRQGDNLVFRGGYYRSVARPQISQLSDTYSLTYYAAPFFGPNFDQPGLFINRGNPDLKPAITDSFDLGAELYSARAGVVKANLFYKRVSNLLESNRTLDLGALDGLELPDHPAFNNLPSNLYVEVIQPVNYPEPGQIWGVELSVERQLDFLPGLFSDLGVYANYTFTDSSKEQTSVWSSKPVYDDDGNIVDYVNEPFIYSDVPFDGSPKHSGTFGFTYSRNNLDASLYQSFQGRRRIGVERFGLDPHIEGVSSLDLRIEYSFPVARSDVRAFFEGRDLLKDAKDPATQTSIGSGDAQFNIGGYYNGGRSFQAGLSLVF